MNRLAIIGAGELGQQIAHIGKKNGYNVVGFFDDLAKEHTIGGLPVFGGLDSIDDSNCCFDSLIIGIGYKHFSFRRDLFEKLNKRYQFDTIIDKTSILDPTATVGAGCVIYPNVTLDKDVIIGENVILNMSCNVCHNSVVGPHSYISPAVNIAGYVNIGSMVFMGIGVTVVDHIVVNEKTIIGAQALVNKDIDEEGVYVGIPARRLPK